MVSLVVRLMEAFLTANVEAEADVEPLAAAVDDVAMIRVNGIEE